MRRPIIYAIVGGINTATDFALFTLMYFHLDWPLLVANTGAFAGAVGQSYLLNRSWTFRDTPVASTGAVSHFSRFVAVNLTALLVSTATLIALREIVPVLVAKILATVVTYLVGYNLIRLLVFRSDPTSPSN